MGRLERRKDPLQQAERLEPLEGLGVGGGDVRGEPSLFQIGVLWTDAWVVQAGGDGVRGQHLSVAVLQEVGQRAMEDTGRPEGEGPAVLAGSVSMSAGLHADQPGPTGTNERREDA